MAGGKEESGSPRVGAGVKRSKMGKPTKAAANRFVVAVKLDEEVHARLESFVAANGVTPSAALRLFVRQGLDAAEGTSSDLQSVAWAEGVKSGAAHVWAVVGQAVAKAFAGQR